jgi:hypothetical protein
MQAQSNLGNNHEKLLVYAIAFAAAAIFFASSANASTTWTITVDVKSTKGNDPPNYIFTSVPPGAPNCSSATSPPLSLGDLYVCAGDTVNWTPLSSGGKGWLTVHQSQGFQHGAGAQPIWLRAREKGTPASVTTSATDYGSIYEYCVSLHDQGGHPTRLYTHDPKIIIGGTNAEVLIEFVKKVCFQLPPLIDKEKDLDDETKKLIVEGCKKFEDIRHPPK